MRRGWLALLGGLIVATLIAVGVLSVKTNPQVHPISELGHVLYTHVDRIYPAPSEYWFFLPKPESEISEPATRTSGTGKLDSSGPKMAGYLGAQACAECHSEKYSSFAQTAHFLTSQTATTETVRGSFERAHATLTTSRPGLRFVMESRPEGLFQNALIDANGVRYGHAERFDLITGSGNHGQSYLYWRGDRLYQLPVTYFSQSKEWVNSPGYTEGTANFSRGIRARCLECHATYFEHVPKTMNRYHRENFILGISCERCHGPGAQHVAHHRSHPDDKQPHAIVNPASLTVERRHDVCRQCHSRSGGSIKDEFTFRPGENLGEYIDLELDGKDAPGQTGLHTANQFARLRMSKCFQKSPEMSCIDCHNPHRNERNDLVVFSQRCQKCHESKKCGVFAKLGDRISRNCIDCHMPSKFDSRVILKTATSAAQNPMRDHYISIDKPLSNRLIEKMLAEPAK